MKMGMRMMMSWMTIIRITVNINDISLFYGRVINTRTNDFVLPLTQNHVTCLQNITFEIHLGKPSNQRLKDVPKWSLNNTLVIN